MRPNLLSLLARNAKRGEFRAEGNTIFLYDVVVDAEWEVEYGWGGVSPEGFLKLLAGMTGTVHLRINSPGGSVFAGRAIAQAMREYDGEIVAHIDGIAASIASIIAVSASRVVMAPGAMMMIHKAWTIGLGNADELRQMADVLGKIDGTLAETYAAKSGNADALAFLEQMAAETWFTAAEAIAAGLADEALDDGAKPANALAQAWDLSAFAKPPAAEAEPIAVEPPPAEPEDPANPVRDEDQATAAAVAEKEQRIRATRAVLFAEPA